MTTAPASEHISGGLRDCQSAPVTGGSYSAWTVGGGTDGTLLGCDSTYPDNVATTMIYGPFSLADAKMAQMHFQLRYDSVSAGDDFCWYAADAEELSNATVAGGLCLNAQPTGWTTLDLNLGDLDTGDPVVSVLGKPQVWVAFRFTSDERDTPPPGRSSMTYSSASALIRCACRPARPRRRRSGAGHQDIANRTMTRVALQGSYVMRYSTPICPDSAS